MPKNLNISKLEKRASSETLDIESANEIWSASPSKIVRSTLIRNPTVPLEFIRQEHVFSYAIDVFAESDQAELITIFRTAAGFSSRQQAAIHVFHSFLSNPVEFKEYQINMTATTTSSPEYYYLQLLTERERQKLIKLILLHDEKEDKFFRVDCLAAVLHRMPIFPVFMYLYSRKNLVEIYKRDIFSLPKTPSIEYLEGQRKKVNRSFSNFNKRKHPYAF